MVLGRAALLSETFSGISFSTLTSFKKSGVEGARQEFAHFRHLHVAREVRQNDCRVAAELPNDLPARPARRSQRGRVDDDRQALETPLAFREGLPDGDALGTHRQAVTRALDVAARVDFPVLRFDRRADTEV